MNALTVGDIRKALARHSDDTPVVVMADECPEDINLEFNGFNLSVVSDGVAVAHISAIEFEDEPNDIDDEDDEVGIEDWDEFDGELELDSSLDDEWNGS